MATGNHPTFPILDLVTQEDMHAASVRTVIARTIPNPDAYLESHTIDSRVAHRIVRGPDGTQSMVAAVVILGAVPKVREVETTPVPEVKR
jgi:hypothetical protein